MFFQKNLSNNIQKENRLVIVIAVGTNTYMLPRQGCNFCWHQVYSHI